MQTLVSETEPGTVIPLGTTMVRTPSAGIGRVGVNVNWYWAFWVPTPSVLPTMAAVPAVVGKAEVTRPPVTGLPVATLLGSTATSTFFRLASVGPVIVTPSEFLMDKVKPVRSVCSTGGRVTFKVILRVMLPGFGIGLGPPD